MITERDEIKCQASMEMVEDSSLSPDTKADLKESLESAKLNLNGRTLEERVLSIAQNQFDTTRFIAEIIVRFGDIVKRQKVNAQKEKTWKDVITESRWAMVALGSIVAVCSIFSENIVALVKTVAGFF